MKSTTEKFEQFLNFVYRKRMGYNQSIANNIRQLEKQRGLLNNMLKINNINEQNKKNLLNKMLLVGAEIKKLNEYSNVDCIKKQLKKLDTLKDVKEIRYHSNYMEIITNGVIINGNNWGKYKITIYGDEIRMERFDEIEVDGCNHPFIKDGYPCYGIWQPTIEKALNNGGYFTIALASIKLLKCTKAYSNWYISPRDFWQELKQIKNGGYEDE